MLLKDFNLENSFALFKNTFFFALLNVSTIVKKFCSQKKHDKKLKKTKFAFKKKCVISTEKARFKFTCLHINFQDIEPNK